MKKTHIIGLGVIAVAVFIVISLMGDASTYVAFKDAKELADAGKGKKVHVVGHLQKDASGNVVGIEEGADKVSFSFVMVDNNGDMEKVFYNNPMPPDFMRSEQVVIIGKYNQSHFVASEILLKCPSKYQEEGVQVNLGEEKI